MPPTPASASYKKSHTEAKCSRRCSRYEIVVYFFVTMFSSRLLFIVVTICTIFFSFHCSTIAKTHVDKGGSFLLCVPYRIINRAQFFCGSISAPLDINLAKFQYCPFLSRSDKKQTALSVEFEINKLTKIYCWLPSLELVKFAS